MKKFIVIGALLIGSLMFLPLLFFGTKASETVGTSTINGVTVPNRTRVSAVTPGALQQAFITKMSAYAPLCKSYGIYPSVMMAQAILESQWGMSDLAVQANNIFGVKASAGWHGATLSMMTTEEYGGQKVRVMALWKKFGSVSDSVSDYCNFCHGRSYIEAGLLTATNYYEQVTALKNGGYATDSQYVDLVCTIIEEYNLDQYDK